MIINYKELPLIIQWIIEEKIKFKMYVNHLAVIPDFLGLTWDDKSFKLIVDYDGLKFLRFPFKETDKENAHGFITNQLGWCYVMTFSDKIQSPEHTQIVIAMKEPREQHYHKWLYDRKQRGNETEEQLD